MKKSLLALAVLGAFAGVAQAQSSVTLYGIADANISTAKGGPGRLTGIESGGLNGSRFGLRGTEDLGGGLKAVFVLENGFNIDTGATAQTTNAQKPLVAPRAAVPATPTSPAVAAIAAVPNPQSRLFGRQAYVGFGGGFGEVRLGRQYTPIGVLTDELGSLATKGADLFAVAGSGGNQLYRTDNAITYLTPNLGGFTAQLQYSTRQDGAEETGVNKKVLEHYGVNAIYKGGPIKAGLAYISVTDTTTQQEVLLTTVPLAGTLELQGVGKQKRQGYGGFFGFDFGVVNVLVAADVKDLKLAKDPTTVGITAGVPLGPVNLAFGYAVAKDTKGSSAAASDDAQLFNVQAVYDLSKRTALYAFYTGVSNDANSQLGFNTPAVDKTSNLFQVGVRHRF